MNICKYTGQVHWTAYHGVCILRQPSHAQQTVVWLDHYVAVLRVGEDTVGLDELLGEPVVEAFEHVGAETRARAASDGVQHHEALERVGAVCLAINHIQDVLMHLLAHAVAHAPVVAGAGAILVYVEVFGVVDVLVGARLDRVEHSGLEI